MSGLTRDGTVESNSRDYILRRERDKNKLFFPAKLTTGRIDNPTRSALRIIINSVYNKKTF